MAVAQVAAVAEVVHWAAAEMALASTAAVTTVAVAAVEVARSVVVPAAGVRAVGESSGIACTCRTSFRACTRRARRHPSCSMNVGTLCPPRWLGNRADSSRRSCSIEARSRRTSSPRASPDRRDRWCPPAPSNSLMGGVASHAPLEAMAAAAWVMVTMAAVAWVADG